MSTTDFEAKVIADSISPSGIRITTMCLTYPRFIHAELMTHRRFSRNAASSRAIPVAKKIKRIREYPVEPCSWGVNKGGMQASEVLSPEDEQKARDIWHKGRMFILDCMEALNKLKVHKQVTNRIGEPWDWMSTLVTSTGWRNFDFLRDHPAADPNICKLAKLRKVAYDQSEPRLLSIGEWHLPYITSFDQPIEDLKKMSAARCARLSYLNHESQNPTKEEDFQLFDRLTSRENPLNDPGHWTPLEHQATPIPDLVFKTGEEVCRYCMEPINGKYVEIMDVSVCGKCSLGHITSGNFLGWYQYRKEFPNEDFDS